MTDDLIARIVNALELSVSAGIPTTLKAHEADALLDALALTQAELDKCREEDAKQQAEIEELSTERYRLSQELNFIKTRTCEECKHCEAHGTGYGHAYYCTNSDSPLHMTNAGFSCKLWESAA